MAAAADSGPGGDVAELSALIERHMLRPFAWARCDCLTVIDAILVARGYPSIAAPFCGLYANADEARRVGRVESRAAERFATLGWPEVSPDEARDGDIGVIANTLAIRCGGWWHAKSEHGCVMKRRARRAWRPM